MKRCVVSANDVGKSYDFIFWKLHEQLTSEDAMILEDITDDMGISNKFFVAELPDEKEITATEEDYKKVIKEFNKRANMKLVIMNLLNAGRIGAGQVVYFLFNVIESKDGSVTAEELATKLL